MYQAQESLSIASEASSASLLSADQLPAAGRLLDESELEQVSGGFSTYEQSLSTAVAFVGLAAGTAVAAPALAGAFAIGSLAASGIAIFTTLSNMSTRSR